MGLSLRTTRSAKAAFVAVFAMLMCLNAPLTQAAGPEGESEGLLMQVLRNGDWDYAKSLVAQGAEVKAHAPETETDSTPLHLAIEHIKENPTDGTIEPDLDLVKAIGGKLSKEDFNNPNGRGMTPLMVAVDTHQWDIVRYLLSQGADPFQDSVSRGLQDPSTPFHRAIARHASIDLLLEMLPEHDTAAVLNSGMDALNVALNKERWDLAKILLERGADPFRFTGEKPPRSSRTFAETRLQMRKKLDPEGESLLQHLKSLPTPEGYINLRPDFRDSFTPLMKALDQLDWKEAELLIQNGADTRKPNGPESMPSPFHIAIMGATLDDEFAPLSLMKAIIDSMDGKAINEKDSLGRTPLGAAIDRHRWDVVDYLLDKGADPAQMNKPYRARREITPLAQAVARKAPIELIQRFLDSEEVRASINDGDDLVARAILKLQWPVAHLLLDYGADPNRDIGEKRMNAKQLIETELLDNLDYLDDETLGLVLRIVNP